MNPSKNQTVEIKKIINNGYGLSHTDDKRTLMVRHGLPGETVQVKILERSSVDYGVVSDVLQPHEGRRLPAHTGQGRRT